MFWLLIFPDSPQCIISAHFTNSNAGLTVHLLGGFWLNESKTWLFAVARSSQLWFCLWGLGQVYFTVMWDCLQRSRPLRWLFADANAILFKILFVKVSKVFKPFWNVSGACESIVVTWEREWQNTRVENLQHLFSNTCIVQGQMKRNWIIPFSTTCFVEGPIKRI
jgi:hypothetical protein